MPGAFLDVATATRPSAGGWESRSRDTTLTLGRQPTGASTPPGGPLPLAARRRCAVQPPRRSTSGSAAIALQEITSPSSPLALAILQKQGLYAVKAAYEVTRWFEPRPRLRSPGARRRRQHRNRLTFCLNFRPIEGRSWCPGRPYTLSFLGRPVPSPR